MVKLVTRECCYYPVYLHWVKLCLPHVLVKRGPVNLYFTFLAFPEGTVKPINKMVLQGAVGRINSRSKTSGNKREEEKKWGVRYLRRVVVERVVDASPFAKPASIGHLPARSPPCTRFSGPVLLLFASSSLSLSLFSLYHHFYHQFLPRLSNPPDPPAPSSDRETHPLRENKLPRSAGRIQQSEKYLRSRKLKIFMAFSLCEIKSTQFLTQLKSLPLAPQKRKEPFETWD